MSANMAMTRMLTSMDSKFIQPGFIFKSEEMKNQGYYDPSVMELKFINGYERKYNLVQSSLSVIKSEVDEINSIVEFERSLLGQDDELDDDM